MKKFLKKKTKKRIKKFYNTNKDSFLVAGFVILTAIVFGKAAKK